jgi:ribosome-associated protein
MPGPLRISRSVEISDDELQWKFTRSSGPGGQSVNTSSTRVELSFDLGNSQAFPSYLKERAMSVLYKRLVDGVITVVAAEHRSQMQNRLAAEERLIKVLAGAIAPPPASRRATKPTRSSQRKRVDKKRQRGEVKRLRKKSDDD